MSAPLRLVVFDVDGTLVDSAALILEGFALAFAAVGACAPPRAAVLANVGLSLEHAMMRLMPGQPDEVIAAACNAYRVNYFEMRAERGEEAVPLFAGTAEMLEALAARDEVLIGMATGMARRGLDHVLEVHGFDRFVVTRQTSDFHPSKPHPAMLNAAMTEAGVERADTVMIGDTTYDIEMAVNAGVAAIGVNWGHHSPEALRAAGAVAVLNDWAELAPTLATIWGDA